MCIFINIYMYVYIYTYIIHTQCILEPGGTTDGLKMVQDFLQRDLDPDAFLVSCGLLPSK